MLGLLDIYILGVKILFWPKPNSEKENVLILKIRVHCKMAEKDLDSGAIQKQELDDNNVCSLL